MSNLLTSAICARIARLGSGARTMARNAELRAGRAIGSRLAEYPKVRENFGKAGAWIGMEISMHSPSSFSSYFAAADILSGRGKAIFPDYQDWSVRLSLIKLNPSLGGTLTKPQVKNLYRRIPRENVELRARILYSFAMVQLMKAVEKGEELNPDAQGAQSAIPSLQRDIQIYVTNLRREIEEEDVPFTVDGTVRQPDVALLRIGTDRIPQS